MRSSSKGVREVPMEETTFCDSMWACLLNDYGDDERSIRTEVTERTEREIVLRRRREAKERRERRSSSRERRSSSRSISKTRSRSKSRNAERHGGRRHRRRGSSAHSQVSSRSKPRRESLSRRESLLEDEDSHYGDDGIPTVEEKPMKSEEEVQIPQAPSREACDPNGSRSNRQVSDESCDERNPAEKQTKMERKRPEKLTTISGDDSPRDAGDHSRDAVPGKRDEAPPVLFRSIKNRYNPRSSSANSPRVMSPVSSPRSPCHLRVESAEFNTMEDYQKKVLESRDKRSGRKFERIQAIRAKSSLSRADP